MERDVVVLAASNTPPGTVAAGQNRALPSELWWGLFQKTSSGVEG
jgi:hypothetical protein